MRKYIFTYLKLFFIYWLILPAVQFLSYILININIMVDYSFNCTLIMLFNFYFTIIQFKKPIKYSHNIGLALSSLIQYLLIGFLISDFDFLLFLIPSVTFINLATLMLLNKYQNKIAILSVFFILIFLSLYVSKPILKYILTSDDSINSDLVIFPDISLVKENNEAFAFDDNGLYFLNFWSIYCGTCIEEMPNYNQLAIDHPKVNFMKVLYAPDSISTSRAYEITKDFEFQKIRLQNHQDFIDSIKKPYFPHLIVVKNKQIVYNDYPFYESDFLNLSLEDLIYKYSD